MPQRKGIVRLKLEDPTAENSAERNEKLGGKLIDACRLSADSEEEMGPRNLTRYFATVETIVGDAFRDYRQESKPGSQGSLLRFCAIEHAGRPDTEGLLAALENNMPEVAASL